jgi:hypothetical protein
MPPGSQQHEENILISTYRNEIREGKLAGAIVFILSR